MSNIVLIIYFVGKFSKKISQKYHKIDTSLHFQSITPTGKYRHICGRFELFILIY